MVYFARIGKGIKYEDRNDKEKGAKDVGLLRRREWGCRWSQHINGKSEECKHETYGEDGESVQERVKAKDEAKTDYLKHVSIYTLL